MDVWICVSASIKMYLGTEGKIQFCINFKNFPFLHFSGLVGGVRLIQAKARAGNPAQHTKEGHFVSPCFICTPDSSLSITFGMKTPRQGCGAENGRMWGWGLGAAAPPRLWGQGQCQLTEQPAVPPCSVEERSDEIFIRTSPECTEL